VEAFMNSEKPDVEAIVARIKQNIREAGESIPEPALDDASGGALQQDLRAVNIYVQTRGGGSNWLIRLFRRVLLRALGLHGFHENIARVLNEMAGKHK